LTLFEGEIQPMCRDPFHRFGFSCYLVRHLPVCGLKIRFLGMRIHQGHDEPKSSGSKDLAA
jgi:hypothetical protein